MNAYLLQQALDHVKVAEDHIDQIQRMAGLKQELPECWKVMLQIRTLMDTAFIKINEGDHLQ